jgi:dTDP-4-dehydrorhamnose 3,5-epimerase
MQPLSIEGAFVFSPFIHRDARGEFLEWFRPDRIAETTGHRLSALQANISVSARGALRGIHFAAVPPGQAKYVGCVRGAVLDVVVDLRVGSPGFGRWSTVFLTEEAQQGLYVAEGLGHGFLALTEGATVIYLCSTTYDPQREHGIHPLDPHLGIDWPCEVEPVLSDKDAAAPLLAQAHEAGLLPSYQDCLDLYAKQETRK